MGSALLARWQPLFANTHFHVIDPKHHSGNETNLTWYLSFDGLPEDITPDVIVLAVKPQELGALLPAYRARFAHHSPLYISIAAGKNLAYYALHLGEHAHVVRAMPNTPALVGQGVTVLTARSTLAASAKKVATDMMSAVGHVEWLEDESLMDAVTAISGCGPAYVFLFLESLIKAGIACGLPESLATSLAYHTVYGSLALTQHSGKDLETLRKEVASPGGATEAALGILLQAGGLGTLLNEAVFAATARSKTLATH